MLVTAVGNFDNTIDLSGVTPTDFTQPGFNTRLVAGDGNDLVIGSALDDTLEGGGGNDTLRGGLGDDSYEFGLYAPLGSDTLEELAGGGRDWLVFFSEVGGVTVDLGSTAAQAVHANL
ncbi:MAG: hypothetical protein GXP27_13895, partial [Planctomycetes bacterium]|nr:hypothetical protein [Planctomycetota bacterium]